MRARRRPPRSRRPGPRAAAPSRDRDAAESSPRTVPDGNGARREAGPRVAHRRRRGHSLQRGSRGRHSTAPTSISASNRSRPRSGRPISTIARSASASVSRTPRTRSKTLRTFTSTAGNVGVVGFRGDRTRGVTADAGQRGHVVGPPIRVDDDRRLPQASRAPWVAEPSPCADDRAGACGGHFRRGREPGEELVVRRGDARNLRLVEHRLRDEYLPPIARRAPRQIVAPVRAVPGLEGQMPTVMLTKVSRGTSPLAGVLVDDFALLRCRHDPQCHAHAETRLRSGCSRPRPASSRPTSGT